VSDPAQKLDISTALQSRKATLAVAESITGGHLQALITSRSGCSAYFLGGITAYSLEQKAKLLGLAPALLAAHNGVSAEIAAQMALSVARLFGSDYALATTGYAEPHGDHSVNTPFAWYAASYRERVLLTTRIDCPNLPREAVQHQVASAALNTLYTLLCSPDSP
jgi:nicotinamide-nucleotide amidase